jgi:hypothetical protein
LEDVDVLLLLLVLLGLVVLAEAAAAAAAALRMGIMEAGKGVAEDDEAFGSEEDDVSKALCAFDCLDRAMMMIYYVCNGMETTGCNLYSLTHSPPASYSLTGPQLKYTRKNMKVSRLTLWNLQVSNVR